jgi:hypothetical protein
MTWAQDAGAAIAEIAKTIPADATLQERRRILNAHRWNWHYTARKAWGRAARQYLESHGQPKGYGLPKKCRTDSRDLLIGKGDFAAFRRARSGSRDHYDDQQEIPF